MASTLSHIVAGAPSLATGPQSPTSFPFPYAAVVVVVAAAAAVPAATFVSSSSAGVECGPSNRDATGANNEPLPDALGSNTAAAASPRARVTNAVSSASAAAAAALEAGEEAKPPPPKRAPAALIAALDEARHRPSEEERDAWIETWGFIAKEMQRGRGKSEINGIKSPPGSAPSSRRTSMEKKRSKGQSAA